MTGWTQEEVEAIRFNIAIVCEVTGTEMSTPAIGYMLERLARFGASETLAALDCCAEECDEPITLSSIVGRIYEVVRPTRKHHTESEKAATQQAFRRRVEREHAGLGARNPHSIDAERSVLGGILLDNRWFQQVVAIVRADDFYRDAHRHIFEAMSALAAKAQPIDRITLKYALAGAGQFEAVGGDEFIDRLDAFVPTVANLAYYATIVHDKAVMRRNTGTVGANSASM